uniref:ATP-dependent Clp protease proteolytic subunit n=1 Tax=Opuntia streptacantha TaxID=393608 RepID=A0A7C8ZK22_OPUST
MATAFLSPVLSATTHIQPVTSENRESIITNGLPKSSFLLGSSDLSASATLRSSSLQGKAAVSRKFRVCAQNPSFDHIPKQFRQENLKDGLMENFKNAPQHLYGLPPKQLEMFMTEDSPIYRQSANVTEESISSARSYLHNSGVCSHADMAKGVPSRYNMSISGARGRGRRPPDLPSLILDSRVVYLGMPIFPAVTELIIAEFLWLNFDDSSKPIYLYINSTGTENAKMETVGSEADVYAIADCMASCKAKVYTVNLTMAFGYAAMLLSLGEKGYRVLLREAFTKLYLPKLYKSSGAVSDMWIKAKELEVNTDIFIEFLSKSTGKPKDEIARDLQHPKLMPAQEAIDYGIADRIMHSMGGTFKKRKAQNYDEMLAQSKAKSKVGARVQGAPSGYM